LAEPKSWRRRARRCEASTEFVKQIAAGNPCAWSLQSTEFEFVKHRNEFVKHRVYTADRRREPVRLPSETGTTYKFEGVTPES